jgi:probable F420-dependent oxidoreductase
MEFGILLAPFRRWMDAEAVRAIAGAAEDLGYAAIWATDHLVAPVGPLEATAVVGSRGEWMGDGPAEPRRATAEDFYGRDNWYLEPYSLMAFLAGITRRIAVGANIIVVPYRNPVVQARMVATLDQLAKGRLILGVGAGHVRSESEVLGVPYAERGRMTDEYLRMMVAMWTQDWASFHGEYFDFDDVLTLGRPVQRPHPPLFAGGMSRPAIRRAVRLCRGWIPNPLPPEQLARGLAYAREEAARVGRTEPLEVIVGVGGYHLLLGEPDQPVGWLGEVYDQTPRHATSDELLASIRSYLPLGPRIVNVSFYPGGLELYPRQMERFAKEVMPAFAG